MFKSANRLVAMPYYGGKSNHLPFILPRLPYTGRYVEPFCGGASVLLNRRVDRIEVLNDLNSDVINFFKVLRDDTDELLYRLHYTPYSREEFIRAREAFGNESMCHIERARLWYLHQCASTMGMPSPSATMQVHKSLNLGSTFHTTFSRRARVRPSTLGLIADRLSDVLLECRNALDVLREYDDDTALFYCDPPYSHSVRSAKNMYLYEQSDNFHRDLSELLHSLTGKVAISGYDGELYGNLYADWYKHVDVPRSNRPSVYGHITSGQGLKDTSRVDVLWTNYPIQLDALSGVL